MKSTLVTETPANHIQATRGPDTAIPSDNRVDYLTGLPSRKTLMDNLRSVMPLADQSGLRFAIIFVSLRRFKQVNDRLGLDAADELLRQAADRINACVDQKNRVARHGGDQFIVMLENITEECETGIIALRIDEALRRPFLIEGHHVEVGASIGLAHFPDDSRDVTALLKNANLAMDRARAADEKNNLCFFAPEMRTAEAQRQMLEDQLREAIDKQQFVLHYQPIYDMQTSRAYGAEALIRWNHPVRGMVGPDLFIPVAEESGMITEIGRWVFTEACRQVAEWRRAGLDLIVSINVSSRQLPYGLAIDTIKETIARHGIKASNVVFEITESAILKETIETLQWINDVDDLGIHLSVDDFGTGYASLGFLQRFRMHNVKIDKSFVMAMQSDARQLAVVRAILDFGRGMGLTVTAEGIEDIGTLDALKALGCTYAQGYHFSRPIPPDRLHQLLAAPPSAAPQSDAKQTARR